MRIAPRLGIRRRRSVPAACWCARWSSRGAPPRCSSRAPTRTNRSRSDHGRRRGAAAAARRCSGRPSGPTVAGSRRRRIGGARIAPPLLIAVGLHLALASARRRAGVRPRRVASRSRATRARTPGGASMFADRPDVPLVAARRRVGASPRSSDWSATSRRCSRRATAAERAALPVAGMGRRVAAAIAAVAAVLNALIVWPGPVGAIAVAAPLLIPLSLVLGASDQLGVRIDRLLVHTHHLRRARRTGRRFVPAHRARSRPLSRPTANSTLLGLSMLAALSPPCCGCPARQRLTEFATRRVYGEATRPTRCCGRSAVG